MSYHRAGSHKSCVIVASQLFQKAAHGRTFNIEASFCFTNPEIFLYLFIVFKFLHCMNINIDTPVPQNYFSALADMAYSPLAQNVEFFKANLFGSIHILSLIHISEPTRLGMISYAVFCLKKKK